MVRVWVIAVLVACHAPPPKPPAPVRSEVHASTPVCVDAHELEGTVLHVLAGHRADRSGLVVVMTAQPVDTGANVDLRVISASGDVGLDRHYTLTMSDCASAVPLLALAVDRWLTAFPEWAEPPPPPMPAPERVLAAALEGTVAASAPPLGVDGALGGFADFGSVRDRFGLSVVARTGWPSHVGGGRVRQLAALAGVTWRHLSGSWQMRVEVRGGLLRVNGLGFVDEQADYLPWWEVSVFGGRSFRWGALGIELAGSANRDHAVTRDGVVSQSLPFLRFGLSGTFGVLER
jgi:hypothetical protein